MIHRCNDYKILDAGSLEELTAAVKIAIKLDWIPQGGVHSTPGVNHTWFYQAVARFSILD